MSHTTAKRSLFCASMLGGMLATAGALAAPALPTGGHVVAGSATIGGGGTTLTVNQTSSKAIVDWSSFGVGQGGTVQFDNGAGATLNRVTGANVSSIDGLLSATGSVYLINPNGVIVGKSGVVNTGGSFVASTLDASNASFLAGGPLTFTGASTASVVNLGKVGSLGGNVGLIAATVRNDGSIAAPKGEAGLIAGSTVTMDDAANDAGGLFSVKVGGASTSVTNTGAIAAAAVELRAQQGNVYALAGNAGGVINATGIDASGGTIKLISEGGTTEVAGILSAQGVNGAGGQIETSGASFDIGGAAVDTHGGTWLLDPTNLIVNSAAATAIDTALASGNVTLATSASGAPTGPAGSTGDIATGNGDIIMQSALTWSTGSTLTLNAFNALDIDAPITVTGAGKAALNYGAGGLSFDLSPGSFTGSLSFAAGTGEGIAGQALTINGTSFTLLYSMSDVAGINGKSSDDALARSITSATTYANSVVGSFSGTLEGLGNLITGLTINSAGSYVGLIGKLNSGGRVRDLALEKASIGGANYVGALIGYNAGGTLVNVVLAPYGSFGIGSSVTGHGAAVGGLVGYNAGEIAGSSALVNVVNAPSGYATGGLVGYDASGASISASVAGADVTGGADYTGGLVGYNAAPLNNVTTSGSVTAGGSAKYVGGLVGYDAAGATITGATELSVDVGGSVDYPGGLVDAEFVGGLAGYSAAAISNVVGGVGVYAPSGVYIGGLVGENAAGGTIAGATVFAANGPLPSPVSGVGGSDVGGLVGLNLGSITGSNASVAVVNSDHGIATGGLVGDNAAGASITASSASAAVSVGDNVHFVGGLVGYNDGTVSNDSSSGSISAAVSSYVGGLVGYNLSAGMITSSFASGAGISASGGAAVGGVAGYNGGTIRDTYADLGSLTGGTYIGGLVGYDVGGVSTSWSSGTVMGSATVGGSVGLHAGGTLADVYWDEGTSGKTAGTGGGASTGITGIGGTTGLSPDAQATYAGFNFTTTWSITPGTPRPYLQNPTPATPPN